MGNKTTTSKLRLVMVALLASVAMVAAACGDDDAASTDTEPPAPSSDDGAPDEPETTEPDEPTTTDGTPEPELTASYRGVTADTIKIGVVLFDQQAIRDLGVDLRYGDTQAHYQTRFDELNARGGVAGRQIEPVFEMISPVDDTAADTACVRLTEDEEVFLVVGEARPATNARCYTEFHDTPFIGVPASLTMDDVESSLVPLISIDTAPWRLVEAAYAAMEAEDAIDGAVIGVFADTEADSEQVRDDLLARGATDVIAAVRAAPEADQLALASEIDAQLQRFQADGVTAVLNLGNSVAVLAGYNRTGFDAPFFVITSDVQQDYIGDQGATDAEVALARAAISPNVSDLYVEGHQPTVACVDHWNEVRPEEAAVPNAAEDAPFNNIRSVARACHMIRIMELTLEAGGVELTMDSWVAGLDDVGAYEASTAPSASVGSDKWDLQDTAVLYTWDAEAGALVATDQLAMG